MDPQNIRHEALIINVKDMINSYIRKTAGDYELQRVTLLLIAYDILGRAVCVPKK